VTIQFTTLQHLKCEIIVISDIW